MHKTSRLAALLLAGAIVAAPAAAQNKPVVTVNGQAISSAAFNAFMTQQKAQGAPDSPELQNAIKEELVRRELLAQEAKKKGFDKNPAVQAQMDLAKQAVLVNAFLTDYVKNHPVSDAQLKAEYDRIKQNIGGTEYKARHVLVDSEDEAKAIIAKLDKGEKFADLAKQSKDPGSKDKGGELGWNTPNAFVKPFSDAMTRLKKNEYTKTPVKSDFGYHVIQLDDSRAAVVPSFEEVKPQLQQRAGQMQLESLLKDLRAKAKIN